MKFEIFLFKENDKIIPYLVFKKINFMDYFFPQIKALENKKNLWFLTTIFFFWVPFFHFFLYIWRNGKVEKNHIKVKDHLKKYELYYKEDETKLNELINV